MNYKITINPVPILYLVEIDYTNWRGERRKRLINPQAIRFQKTEWHPEPQWLLQAVDVEDNATVKLFAMKDIHAWEPHHDGN